MLSVHQSPMTSMTPSDASMSAKKSLGKKNKTKFISLDEFEKREKLNTPVTSAAALAVFESDVCAIRPHPEEFYKGYRGAIQTKFKGPQYLYINDVRDVILFSQRTVSDFNKGETCDYPLDMLADALFVEFKKDLAYKNEGCLDVVNNGDGTFTSLDNRRLLIAKKIGLVDRTFGIWIRVHDANENLPSFQCRRFEPAKTWGEAVAKRVNNPKIKGYANNPTIMDGLSKKNPQTIPLNISELDFSALHEDDVAELKTQAKAGIFLL